MDGRECEFVYVCVRECTHMRTRVYGHSRASMCMDLCVYLCVDGKVERELLLVSLLGLDPCTDFDQSREVKVGLREDA